ncbi:hypothetical protein D8674_034843 [Pyrus ussuriensis x Pyrus communis]|uniref:Uncharacterized protein n=1 Tax=Pyrus ussuriensis x Pyrus communis TaxID=2448454 RepID=A0A5N5GBL6_9ROSA|nr:hypothetical protein D8674_034843 [Pyrus ussuriensis x Pyrus communis]
MMETGKPKIEVVALKLPLSVRGNNCSNVMTKNTELNVHEESSREEPRGTPKLLLMFDCTKCSARIAVKTDEERRTFCEEYIESLYKEAMQRRSLDKSRDIWVKILVDSHEVEVSVNKENAQMVLYRERIEELDEKIPFDQLPPKNKWEPIKLSCKTKKESNGDRFCHWTEGFSVVQALLLVKSFCNQQGFIPVNGAIRCYFNPKNPLISYKIVGGRRGYKRPSKEACEEGEWIAEVDMDEESEESDEGMEADVETVFEGTGEGVEFEGKV